MDTANESKKETSTEVTPSVCTAELPPTPESAPSVCTAGLDTPNEKTPLYKNQTVIAGVVALILIIGAGCYVNRNAVTNFVNSYKTVATVNGVKISESEFQKSLDLVTKQSATISGVNLEDPATQEQLRAQALDILVNNALITSAANKAGITVTDADIQTRYDALVKEVGSQENLNAKMAEIGLTEKALRSNIERQVLADRYIEQETDIKSLTVSDDEIQEFLKTNVPEGTELPPLEEIRPQIEAELLTQKQQELVMNLLTKLHDEATIEIK